MGRRYSVDKDDKFKAEAKDMTADSTVAEIEAMGGSAIGIEVDVNDHKAVEPWS
jgi:hypothetical protein